MDHKEWIQADGLTFHTDACINLWRIYTSITDSSEDDGSSSSLEYLVKALKLATESKYLNLLKVVMLYKKSEKYDSNIKTTS